MNFLHSSSIRVNIVKVGYTSFFFPDLFPQNMMPYTLPPIPLLLYRADSVYEDMKQKYGTQGCYLLKINSRTGDAGPDEQMPDPWSQYLQKINIHSSVSFTMAHLQAQYNHTCSTQSV